MCVCVCVCVCGCVCVCVVCVCCVCVGVCVCVCVAKPWLDTSKTKKDLSNRFHPRQFGKTCGKNRSN